ncbi:MAG TPA: histidine kinase dimerization/phosphoacceptor domain -containing protein [Clostridia bacterium]|nr:histidine kinase dimerization/phosphoacceptor domain -containing protein [Clostridia bacterium]
MHSSSSNEQKFNELRRRAEKALHRQTAQQKDYIEYHELLHELEVHQKELEMQNEELQESHSQLSSLYRKYAELYDFAPCGYITLSPKGIILQANLTASKLLGAERNLLTKMSLVSFFQKDDSLSFNRAVKKALEEDSPQREELELLRRDGQRLWILLDIVADFTDDGTFSQWRITFNDISERVKAEREKEEKDQLLSEVHHRIKNHMTTLYSMISYQASQHQDSRVTTALRDAAQRIQVMQTIYRNLYADKVDGSIDLSAFLQQLIEDIKGSCPLHARINFVTKLDEIQVSGKQSLPIGIAVNELVSNAVKYALNDENSGEIYISVGKKRGVYIEIVVQDKGAGIPDEVVQNKKYGFGLQLLESYAKQYNGKLQIENRGGTKITLTMELE